jgi:integrase
VSKLIRKSYPRIRQVVIKGETLFQIDARKKGTTGRREYRSSKQEAEDRAREIASDLMLEGTEGMRMRPELRVAALNAEAKLAKHGRSLSDAVAYYLKHLEAESEKERSLTVRKLANDWFAFKKKKVKRGVLRQRTLDGIKEASDLLKANWGNLRIVELNEKILRAYLDSLKVSQRRIFNLRSLFSQFFNWCVKQGLASTNPLKNVEIELPLKDVVIMTVEQAQTVMKTCEEKFPELTLYFAVGLFAGLRPDEAKLLTWEKIDIEDREMTVLSITSKVKETRMVKIEDTLFKWLKYHKGDRKGHIVAQKGFRTATEDVRIALGHRLRKQNKNGPRWVPDILRHSYASYWLPIHRDRGRLAEQMGTSIKMIKEYYKAPAKASEAASFWNILPQELKNEDAEIDQAALRMLET